MPGLDGWKFRGRRMIRGMRLMNFPRYIHREARDFFYLTLRHVLPGADIAASDIESEGHWQTRGLPQHGFPFALATTSLRPDPQRDLRVELLKIDPRVVAPQGGAGVDAAAPAVVVFSGIARTKSAHPTLWLAKGAFSIADRATRGSSRALLRASPPPRSLRFPAPTPRSASPTKTGC